MNSSVRAFALVAALALAGCATGSESMNRISLGMTKGQVIAALGSPKSVSAVGGIEVMHYPLSEYPVGGGRFDRPLTNYVVRLRDGRVDAYGRDGEFSEPVRRSAPVQVINQIQINNSPSGR